MDLAPLPFAHTAPAGGAPLEDVIPATIVGLVLAGLLVLLGWAHRTQRTQVLARAGTLAERATGLPAWSSLPGAITGISLVTAVFGFYWDVATHIDNGRDPGPFANPSHWFILVGLVGIAVAGATAIILGSDDDRPSTAWRIRDDWHVPVGGVLLLVCGLIALAGFPLDDVWHRLFGQDVTLWGPTHIQMVGGASLATLAQWALFVEGGRARPARLAAHTGASRSRRWLVVAREVAIAGGFLIGLSTLQGEFDFGVPQFRLLYQPVLIAFAAGVGLVTARIRLGRGGALAAAGFFVVVRGLLSLVIGPGLDRILLHFPLYLVEAALVEVVALRVTRDRQFSLGLWAGAAIGTVGVAAEWAWSQMWMPLAWPATLLPEAAVLGLAAGVTGGLVGGAIGRALAPPRLGRQTAPRGLSAALAVGVVVVLGWPLPMTSPPEGLQAGLDLEQVTPAPDRTVHATVTISDADAAADAAWLTVTAWQGAEWRDEQSIVDPLRQVAPGVYRTTRPIPVHGDWKAMVRLQTGRMIAASPIHLPADEAIDAPAVPAEDGATRAFVYDKEILQREARDTAAWLWNVGYAVLAVIGAVWVAALWVGLARIDRSGARRRRPDTDEDAPPAERSDGLRPDPVGAAPQHETVPAHLAATPTSTSSARSRRRDP